jgi:hypothetical protein
MIPATRSGELEDLTTALPHPHLQKSNNPNMRKISIVKGRLNGENNFKKMFSFETFF